MENKINNYKKAFYRGLQSAQEVLELLEAEMDATMDLDEITLLAIAIAEMQQIIEG